GAGASAIGFRSRHGRAHRPHADPPDAGTRRHGTHRAAQLVGSGPVGSIPARPASGVSMHTDTAAQPLTVREPGPLVRTQLDMLVDAGSFLEFGSQARHRTTAFGMYRRRPAGDGVVTGVARIAGRAVGVYVQDPTVLGGSLGEMHAEKIARVLAYAERARIPVVGLIQSGGARIQEGVAALDGYGKIFRGNVRLSGRVPQVSVVLGSCAGGAVYSPAL